MPGRWQECGALGIEASTSGWRGCRAWRGFQCWAGGALGIKARLGEPSNKGEPVLESLASQYSKLFVLRVVGRASTKGPLGKPAVGQASTKGPLGKPGA